MNARFVLPGQPQCQQRPRLGRGGHFYDPCGKERKALSLALLAWRMANGNRILTGDLKLTIGFFYERKRGGKRDISNMLKFFEDSANKVLWDDDNQLREIHAFKCESTEPRTEVEVEAL